MSEGQESFKAAMRALVEETALQEGAHITPERLIAYHQGELSSEDERRIQDHLVVCRECTALLLDLEAFPALDQRGARPLSDADVAAAWQEMKSRIQPREAMGFFAGARQWFGMMLSPARLPYAIAASLFIVSLALTAWIVSLRQENQHLMARLKALPAGQDQDLASIKESLQEARRRLAEAARRDEQYRTQIAQLQQSLEDLSQPQVNMPIADLYPQEFIRGQEEAIKAIEVPSGANFFALILNVPDQRSYASYALEIADRDGRAIWRGRGLRMSSYNNFTVMLPRRLFPAGEYRIALYGLRDGRRELVERYALRIRYQ